MLSKNEATGGFTISQQGSAGALASGVRDDYVYALTCRRDNFKDRVNKKSWTLILSGSDKIPVGYNKGETYSNSYGDDIVKVRKDIKYWKSKANLNEDQQLHLTTLIALEQHIIKVQEKAFKS